MIKATTIVLVISSLAAVFVVYLAGSDIYRTISPQGCRMSWMSPSYILQSEFNLSLTPFGSRYSLWLYREVGWESNEVHGLPVLFIPGNAGSSHQVRSVASSAIRQYYSSPYVISSEFNSRGIKSLDFFAVEFNEDLSAFHGPTLDSQAEYTSDAISYILSRYPPHTCIIVVGHSMGGVVGTSLLPSDRISAIITLSTPHTLPPARFDSRIDEIYAHNLQLLLDDPTPIVSVCGGATDMMIPSESCILPFPLDGSDVYRSTVFTAALEGAWTGVGHREMVWCHQVRWRIARAALELGAETSADGKATVLDKWLRDGHKPPPVDLGMEKLTLGDSNTYEVLSAGANLILESPRVGTYLLRVPPAQLPSRRLQKFVLFLSEGAIMDVSPHSASALRASAYVCTIPSRPQSSCAALAPSLLKLIPNPVPGQPFPVPDEGSEESEGVVLFEADIPPMVQDGYDAYVAVRIETTDGRGWVVGGFDESQPIINDISSFGLLFHRASILLADSQNILRKQILFPNLVSSALIIYRLIPQLAQSGSDCEKSNILLPPSITHTSFPAETHYYSLHHSVSDTHRTLLHSHTSAPYIPAVRSSSSRGVNLTIYSSGWPECRGAIGGFEVTIDWRSTLGRLASRYLTTLVSWAIGIVALLNVSSFGEEGQMPSVQQALTFFVEKVYAKLTAVSFLLALFPFSRDYYMGTEGEPIFAVISPLLVSVATGLVCASWWLLVLLMWPLGRIGRLFFEPNRREDISIDRTTVLSTCFILFLILVFIPWQVAFLGCWIIYLSTCAMSAAPSKPFPGITAIPLLERVHAGFKSLEATNLENIDAQEAQTWRPTPQQGLADPNRHAHILLLMTWLLPLAAPVLAVWVRTLLTAGWTTPFNGDHNILKVAPFLILVEITSRSMRSVTPLGRYKRLVELRWGFLVVAVVAFFLGPRAAYRVYDAASCQIAVMIIATVTPQYLSGSITRR